MDVRIKPSTLSNPDFVDTYLSQAVSALRDVRRDQIAACAALLLDAYDRDALVLVAGNGGSAALAGHFVCDLTKTVYCRGRDPSARRFRVVSLSDNVPTLTAWGNDVGYDTVFAEQVRALGRKDDVLLVISASGNSPNVLQALSAAQAGGLRTAAWLGFDGGKALAAVDCPVLVPIRDYGIAEAAHDLIAHLITAWVAETLAQVEVPQAVGY